VLAYVFWHRPRPDVERGSYEAYLQAFHATLDVPSACFRLGVLPWRHEDGYEDWYLVEDWAALGALNEAALAAPRRAEHDAAAAASDAGWGGVYRLIEGAAEPPEAVRWAHERGEAQAVWQRQMVLGPAPEFCLAGGPPRGRERIC
jgi:hypothetical protein